MIGGSTTSLLSILGALDYSKYEVDLICLSDEDPLYDMIPDKVSNKYIALETGKKAKFKKVLNPYTVFYAVISRIVAKAMGRKYISGSVKSQIMNKETARISKRIDKEYDIAIAFIETWATYYVEKYVRAKKKIAWYHLDYIGSRFYPEFDRKTYKAFNNIVLVSKQCKTNFDKVFPEYANKTCCIENILTKEYIRNRACEFQQSNIIRENGVVNLVTTCRIDFLHKGLDRAVAMMAQAKKLCIPKVKIKWHIIGHGGDYDELNDMIKNLGLEDDVYLYGAKKNPLPWVKAADLYFLPSRYEGKPMAVTEALLLEKPVMVTRYASADGQIRNDVDGIVIDNSDEGILDGFLRLYRKEILLEHMAKVVENTEYSNLEEMEKIYEILEK